MPQHPHQPLRAHALASAFVLPMLLMMMLPSPAAAHGMDMDMSSNSSSLCGSMFLHQDICDVVLFASFVPNSVAQYVAALVTTAALAAASVCLDAAKRKLIRARADAILNAPRPVPTQVSQPAQAQPPRPSVGEGEGSGTGSDVAKTVVGGVPTKTEGHLWKWQQAQRMAIPGLARSHGGAAKAWYLALQGGLTFISVLLRYLVMLIVMTFNIGLILAACAGYAIGSAFFDDHDDVLAGAGIGVSTDLCA
ncbi:hypothetical protein HDU82_009016 [Entophlyctis luteolus]|nr:hypothetical protein HDU82_009016 [Entophlyctis luteolus]KAJ3394077.1 hypothetical protein HDU84_000105 [Entophlyctis sp. JEL0112]